MSQVYVPITPVELPHPSAGWQDCDVSAYVPSGATGVALRFVNTHATNYNSWGVRQNGSTDSNTDAMNPLAIAHASVGCDANRVFEFALTTSVLEVDTYLLGYYVSGAVFKTNLVDKSVAGSGSWTDVDISANIDGATAIGALFYFTDTYARYGIRKNGCTQDRYASLAYSSRTSHAFTGLDGSYKCEVIVSDTDKKCYLVAYFTTGIILPTDATDISLSSTGSYQDININTDAIAAIVEAYDETGYKFDLRKNGSSEAFYTIVSHHIDMVIECDVSGVIEGKIESTVDDFWLFGYFEKDLGINAPVLNSTVQNGANIDLGWTQP